MNRASTWTRAPVAGYVVALCAVCVVTALIALVDAQVEIANISMLFLLAVIGVAVVFGQGPAVFAAVASFFAFDVFFIEPRYAVHVSEPSEWVALGLFLITAVITGQLAARQRMRAIEAEQREREMALLYDLARLMVSLDIEAGLMAVAGRLRDELSLAAVSILIQNEPGKEPASIETGEPAALSAARSAAIAPGQLLKEGLEPTATSRGGAGRWIRAVPSKGAIEARGSLRPSVVPIRSGSRRLGTLAIVRNIDAESTQFDETRLLTSVSAQIGAAVQLDRLRDEATETEALRRADELKTALVNAVSHDLRSPLAAIIASAGSLQQTDVSWTEKERQEFAEGIENEAQRLNRLVGNLLDISRIESGSLKPDRGWYDLAALIDEVLGRMKPVLTGRELIVRVPEDMPPVSLDYIEIDEVLSNLLENANKYTPPGSPIKITVRLEGNQVLVIVADNGPGVAPAAMQHVFEPFYRAPNTVAKGTGLGLAVARGLVEAHGGAMSVRNREAGGAAFSFSLPIGEGSPEEDEGQIE